MKLPLTIGIVSNLSIVFSSHSLALESPKLSLSTNTRNDIDYSTLTLSLAGSAITKIGKLNCQAGRETGDTRIDSFNEIFGLDSVLQAEWMDYSADRLKCSYGMMMDIATGRLTVGLGFDKYNGSTEFIAGGKKNDIDGLGLLLDYEFSDQKHRLSVINKDMVFLSRHTVSYGDYDSNTHLNYSEFDYTGSLQSAYISIKHSRGEKSNRYTTPLLPDNNINYALTQFSAGPVFKLKNNARLTITPLLISGSDRGSFNALKRKTELNGIEGSYKGSEYSITLVASAFYGQGKRSYRPATDKLLENKKIYIIPLRQSSKADILR